MNYFEKGLLLVRAIVIVIVTAVFAVVPTMFLWAGLCVILKDTFIGKRIGIDPEDKGFQKSFFIVIYVLVYGFMVYHYARSAAFTDWDWFWNPDG